MSSEAERMSQLEILLNEAWRENRGEVLARVDMLRQMLVAARAGTLDRTARAEGDSMAHKLAGVLGTFGLREASRAALDIETMLAAEAELSDGNLEKFEASLAVIGEGLVKRDQQASA